MNNESNKTSVTFPNFISGLIILIILISQVINIKSKKVDCELKEIPKNQTYVTDNVSNACYNKNYSTSEYETTSNDKSINSYSNENNNTYSNISIVNMEVNNNFVIPICDTSFKAYMDYRCITDETTVQWNIQQKAWTDNDGFRRINDDYIVAMGTYYVEECGKRFRIIFDSNSEITVIVGDIKQDCHTDSLNQYTPVYDENGVFISANVLEFIVDLDILSEKSQILGTVDCYEYLSGNIKSIERIEN